MNHFNEKYREPRNKAFCALAVGSIWLSLAIAALAAHAETPAQDAIAPDSPSGSALSYLYIAGATFHPLNNATSYSYPSGGCIAKTGGTETRFVHKVILPEGAVARYLRLYYYDTSASDVSGFFTTYDAAGNFSELATVSSGSGATGYSSQLSPDIGFTVDRYASAINILVNLGNQNDATLRFCGVRIAYEAPTVDRIFVDGFDPIL